jgi:plastocyanin
MRLALVSALAVLVAPVSAQSLLYRSPNLSGTWVPDRGVVQFNFLHRFYVAPAVGGHAVVNFPTFTLATGVVHRVAIGTWFATKSPAGTGRGATSTNETEVFLRWRAVGGPEGSDGLHLSVTPAYSLLARSPDGEVAVDYTLGALTLEGAARLAGKPLGASGGARAAFAGGAVARLTRYVAISADVGSFVNPTVRAAWSAALQIAIPNTPHTFALEVSNAPASTIQGNSIGASQRLYGFEFTIPLHLRRFAPLFRKATTPTVMGDAGAPVAATVEISGLKFQQDTVVIPAGQAVRWNNTDPLGHTVTFDDGEPGSALIQPNTAFIRRFARPGVYRYHCTPHPFMTGVVVVR